MDLERFKMVQKESNQMDRQADKQALPGLNKPTDKRMDRCYQMLPPRLAKATWWIIKYNPFCPQ